MQTHLSQAQVLLLNLHLWSKRHSHARRAIDRIPGHSADFAAAAATAAAARDLLPKDPSMLTQSVS